MLDTWLEIWTRPGAATFEPIAADPDATTWSATVRLNGVGEGVMQVPEEWEYFPDVFYQDPDDPSLAKRALVRVWNRDLDYPVYEWIIDASTPPEQRELGWQIDGPGIEAIVGDVILEPFDWDGTDQFVSFFPDWLYGAENLIDVENRYNPAVIRIQDNGNTDGGTFTISVNNVLGGTPTTTGNIPFDATPTAVYNELILLGSVDAAEVDGEPGDYRIQLNAPQVSQIVSTNSVGLSSVRHLSLYADNTGGTFTLTINGNPTNPIAYNATAATIETEIELLAGITDATVTSQNGYFRISFENPETVSTFTADFSGLTGGSGGDLSVPGAFYVATTETGGGNGPKGWISSEFAPTGIQHGTLLELRMWESGGSDPALPVGATTAIMFNGLEPFFPGIQTTVDVTPGATIQAGAEIYVQGTSTVVKLVLRDLADGLISATSFDEQLVPSNTWTQFTINDVQVPLSVEEVVFRVGHTGTGDPPRIFVANPYLREGLPEATVGKIWVDLYNDATTDHPTRAAAGSGAWWDGTRRYLDYDFTDLVDSNGVAWIQNESLTLKRGQNYLKVLSKFAELGYEWRVVPKQSLTLNAADDGVWTLRIFNPGTGGTDLTADPKILLHQLVRSGIRQFGPNGTRFTVEGAAKQSARSNSLAAENALGHIERYIADRDILSIDSLQASSDFSLAQSISRTQSLNPVVSPVADDPQPLVDYTVGDSVNIQTRSLSDPTDTATIGRRIISVTMANSPIEGQTYQLALGSESFVGVGAIYEGVRVLLDEFQAIREDFGGRGVEQAQLTLQQSGSGANGVIIIAAADAPENWREAADFVCLGSNDEATIIDALESLDTTEPETAMHIKFSPGKFRINMANNGVTYTFPSLTTNVIWEGCGFDTQFNLYNEPANNTTYAFNITNAVVDYRDFRLTDGGTFINNRANGMKLNANHSKVERVIVDYIGGTAIFTDRFQPKVRDCYLIGGFGTIFDSYESSASIHLGSSEGAVIEGNYIIHAGIGIRLDYVQESSHIHNNDIWADGVGVFIMDANSGSIYGSSLKITNNRFKRCDQSIFRPFTPNNVSSVFPVGNAGWRNGIVISGNEFDTSGWNRGAGAAFPDYTIVNYTGGAIAAIDMAAVATMNISDNTFIQSNDNDIILRGGHATYLGNLNPQQVVISNNVFMSVNANDTYSSVLILNEDNSSMGGIKIIGNAWYMDQNWAVEFRSLEVGVGSLFYDCSVQNNTAYGPFGLILLDRWRGGQVSGNVLRGMYSGGDGKTYDKDGIVNPGTPWVDAKYSTIFLMACEDVTVSENTEKASATGAHTESGSSMIELDADCTGIHVRSNNYFAHPDDGTTQRNYGLIVENGATNCYAVGNDFRDAVLARFLDPGAALTLTYTGGAGIGDNW